MFQELKKKYLMKYLVVAVIMMAAGVGILALKASDIKVMLSPKADLFELYADEIVAPMRVEADIDFLVDYYAYTTENGVTTEKEYFIPVGEAEYMGVVLDKSYLLQADCNMEATWDYMDGDETAYDDMETIHVTGTVLPLEGESRQFYDAYINDLGWTEEELEIFLPYVLKVGYIGESSTGQLVFFLVLGGIFLLMGIIWLILGLRGSYMKDIKKYCEQSGSPEMTKARLEQFYAATREVCGMRISPEYFLSTRGGEKVLFAETREIIWAYLHVVRHSVNLIPVAKTYSIMLEKADGKRIEVTMKNKKKAEAAMDHIAHVLPYVFLGFDDQIQAAYQNNRPAMIQAVEERRRQLYGDPAPMAGGTGPETTEMAADR